MRLLTLCLLSGCAWWQRTTVVSDVHREASKAHVVEAVQTKTVADSGARKATRTTRTVTRKPTGETIDVTVFDVLEGSWAHLATTAEATKDAKTEAKKSAEVVTEQKGFPWQKLAFCIGVVLLAAIAMWRIMRGAWL